MTVRFVQRLVQRKESQELLKISLEKNLRIYIFKMFTRNNDEIDI